MKLKTIYLWSGLFMCAWLAGPLAAAEPDTDDGKLQTEQQEIDKDKPIKTDAQKVSDLSKQFNVPESTVQDLRAKGQGWGEITIGLATAQELAKTDPKTYPTLSDALTKVESMRASGEGWGKIAKDLGFKLGPVVSAAHRAGHELNETSHMEKHERGQRIERLENTGHPGHSEHPNRPERPGR